MRKDQAYFDSKAIGSSLLSKYIQSPDHALMETVGTSYMEKGRIWEDLVEFQITGGTWFHQKYFLAEAPQLPESKRYLSIPDILDSNDIPQAVARGYIYNQPKKKGVPPQLSMQKGLPARHAMLNEIKANAYKRPIPVEDWADMQRLWNNFRKATYKGRNIVNLLKSLDDVQFQVQRYWTDLGSGAECRMKSDIEAVEQTEDGKKGMLIDLKWTSFTPTYGKENFRWQDRHYLAGYTQHCLQMGIEPPYHMIFIIPENKAPYLTHVQYIESGMQDNEIDYQGHIAACWQWIQAGKPQQGFKEEPVNRFFRPMN